MRLVIFLSVALAATSLVASGEQQRILRRVIKSTPTASNLGRVRAVTVRSSGPEKGAVSEISSKEAAAFGTRSTNETSAAAASQLAQQATKTKPVQTPSTSTTTTSTAATPSASSPKPTTTTTTTSTTTSTTQATIVPKASERQQVAPQAEVELLASAPSSWQMMSAVEAPAAALIAAGTRAASSSDLSSSSSEESSSSSSSSGASYAPQGDFLRSSSGKTSYSATTGETFSRLRQQSGKTRQQQQSFFYPQQQQQQQLRATSQGKTSNYQAAKTHWYQPSTTPRPAPIIQQQQQQEQYEQQNEQYVEQQQVESAAPPGQAEPFAFDFNTQDTSGNGQYRKEESDNNGVVRGSYGFRDASGMYRHVEYVADANGFRANIKSNEPGLNAPEGVETQPASTRFSSGGQAPAQPSQRFTAPASNNQDNSGEWQAASASSDERANLALAPPDFESSHKPERIQRAARHFRN